MPAPSIHAFAEKVTLIINGGEGVGRAAALQLALQGAYVIVAFSDESEESERALNELKSLGTLAHSIKFTDAKTLIDEVEQIYGRIDLLINCVKSADDSAFQINSITNEAVRLMNSRPKPSIVNVSTDEKAAALTKHFAAELPEKFRVNCVIVAETKAVKEFDLFTVSTADDTARVVTFLLSSEAKALNGQVLYAS
jgi:enoyl-[acyl-carrier-protein] reductase (NADH)